MIIPKVVYRSVPTLEKISPDIHLNFEDLVRNNPGWEQIIFDDASQDSFIRNECSPEVVDAYFKINPAYGPARSDLFRYVLLHQRGGIWLDDKSGLSKTLDSIISVSDQFLLAPVDYESNAASHHRRLRKTDTVELMQWFIASAPGHPFLGAVLEDVITNINSYRPLSGGVGKKAVLNLTGPVAFSLAISPIRDKFPHKVISARKSGVLYSKMSSTTAHYQLYKKHYSKIATPIVRNFQTNNIIDVAKWFIESLIAFSIGKIRVWNHQRMELRRQRKPKPNVTHNMHS